MGYLPPPGQRINYDLDGSIGFLSRNAGPDTSVVELSPQALSALNADKNTSLHVNGDYILSLGGTPAEGTFWDVRPKIAYWNVVQGVPLATTPQWVAILFPTRMRIRGVFAAQLMDRAYYAAYRTYQYFGSYPMDIQCSSDTSNGMDGTWVTVASDVYGPGWENWRSPGWTAPVLPDGSFASVSAGNRPSSGRAFRRNFPVEGEGIIPVSGTATRQVRGVRIILNSSPVSPNGFWATYGESGAGASRLYWVLFNLHLYGELDTQASDERLSFVTGAGDDMDFSLGDVHAGQILVKEFRVRNLSSSAAHGVEVSSQATTPTSSPGLHTAIGFSLDGTYFSSQLSLGTLPASSDSAVVTMRATIPPGILGPWGPRVLAEVGEWI